MEEKNNTDSTVPNTGDMQQQHKSAFPHGVGDMTGYSAYSGMTNENYPGMNEDHMMNSLMSDKNIPKKVLSKYWWVFAKDVVLTFLDKDRKKMKLLAFDISRVDYLLTLPYYEYTFEVEQELNNIRNIYDIKLDRALGTDKASQINERIAQRSQFAEQRQTIKQIDNDSGSSFLGKLLNRKR